MTTLDGGSWGGSRKRARTSRNDSPSAAMAHGDYSTISPPNSHGSQTRDVQDCTKSCHHETVLRSINAELETMRTLLTCQVCQRLMYEPFALSCGHTFCYSCIDQWMHHKKECPTCRCAISQEPTQSYALRELVLVFASSNLLLADGETPDEHAKLGNEERNTLMNDKENLDQVKGGLFKGLFKPGDRLVPIRDHIDGVDRCPECNWEIEDGYCNQCGRPVGEDDFDDDDFDNDEEEDDTDEDGEDYDEEDQDHDESEAGDGFDDLEDHDFHRGGEVLARLNAQRTVGAYRNRQAGDVIDLEEDEDRSSDDEEHDANSDGFIVDDDAEIIPLTDDEDIEREGGYRFANERAISIESSDGEDSDDEPRGTAGPRARQNVAHRQRRPVYIVDSDAEEDEGESGAGSNVEDIDDRSSTQTPNADPNTYLRGFSPIQLTSSDEESDEQDEDQENGYARSVTADATDDYASDQEASEDDDESHDGVGYYGEPQDYDEEDEEDEEEDDDL